MLKQLFTITALVAGPALLTGCSGSSSESGSYSSNGGTSNPPPASNTSPETPIVDAEATTYYFSYDDSASTASRDLSFAEINAGRHPNRDWGRAYEFLNAENFNHFNLELAGPFAISMGLYQASNNEVPLNISLEGELYGLGVNISGPTLNKMERNNVVLTLLVDTSGSMGNSYSQSQSAIQSRMDVTQQGLLALTDSLKAGDIVNLVAFNSSAETELFGWSFDADLTDYENAVNRLYAHNGTNIASGIAEAYRVANENFDPEKSNRIILLTDANANAGEVDPSIIADHISQNGAEGIHLAGVGIGEGFNDDFLNTLTDIGKSVYAAMITPADADRLFRQDFIRFIDTAVSNVKFQLTYPQNFDQLKSAAEEISEQEDDVQTINFAYNSEQFFLEMFSKDREAEGHEQFALTITYDDPAGEPQSVTLEKSLDELLGYGDDEIKSAATVVALTDLIAGRIDCETATTSALYQQAIMTYTFTTYHNAIEKYCAIGNP
ncbi:MAG TPA: VWA domain-containing protein [Marinagarivorans sp.]